MNPRTKSPYYVRIGNQAMTLRQAAEAYGIRYKTLLQRWYRGWDVEDLVKPTVSREETKRRLDAASQRNSKKRRAWRNFDRSA